MSEQNKSQAFQQVEKHEYGHIQEKGKIQESIPQALIQCQPIEIKNEFTEEKANDSPINIQLQSNRNPKQEQSIIDIHIQDFHSIRVSQSQPSRLNQNCQLISHSQGESQHQKIGVDQIKQNEQEQVCQKNNREQNQDSKGFRKNQSEQIQEKSKVLEGEHFLQSQRIQIDLVSTDPHKRQDFQNQAKDYQNQVKQNSKDQSYHEISPHLDPNQKESNMVNLSKQEPILSKKQLILVEQQVQNRTSILIQTKLNSNNAGEQVNNGIGEQQKSNELVNEIDEQFLKNYFKKIQEDQYDRIINQLQQQISQLRLKYDQLSNKKQQQISKNQVQIIESDDFSSLQKSNKKDKKLGFSSNVFFYAITPIAKQINLELPTKQSPAQNQNKVEEVQQKSEPNNKPQAQGQLGSMVVFKESLDKKVNPGQFSSGTVQNLLIQEDSQTQKQRIHKQKQSSLNLVPVVNYQGMHSSTFSMDQQHKNSGALPLLLNSQSNILILKQSNQELSYDKFHSIMNLDKIISRISFKEKHYPSPYSTQKQLRLYGKRLFRLLIDQFQNQSVPINNYQNDMEIDKTEQSVIYYLKNVHNFIIVCYFNHTIFIGEYITQGPLKQIIRQGYGIQIRQSKYVYQGDFFADKKHGFGFIEFTGKNPFLHCGYFLDGFMDGYGKSVNQMGQTYIGQFKIGQRDGFGKLIYNSQKQLYYEGEFYDGHKHGKGFQVFQNGDSYSGFYVRDKFQGQGQYKWKNGTIYRGTFSDGYKHGKGLLIFKNGKQFEKYYDRNRQITFDNNDDKKTVKSSRVSTFTQSKVQEKTLIQQRPKNTRSLSRQSLLSNRSKDKPSKMSKQKKKISELLKQKQIAEDLRNLDSILKDNTQQSPRKRIFSIKKLDIKDKLMGKMYSTTERPAMKISEGEIDLFKLSTMGKRKSLINFNEEQKLQDLDDSAHYRRVHPVTNFSQF